MGRGGARAHGVPNSTDLSFGRRPESKPVEFGICTLLVVEILAILSMKRLKRLIQSLVTRLWGVSELGCPVNWLTGYPASNWLGALLTVTHDCWI